MSACFHKPVLLAEVLEALKPQPGGRYVDATVGGGGHAEAILARSAPDGFLYGFDRDAEALAAAEQRLAPFAGRFELRQANFAEMGRWIEPASCHGVLFDLGVSSHQLEQAERGFSFQRDGPLDMRMDPRQQVTAADVVNRWDEEQLTRLFREVGGEPQARRFARAIVAERRVRPFTTTGQLAGLIERLVPRAGRRRHPATKVFLALRCQINLELESLKSALAAALALLKPGGRLAVITYHSAEDRIVKQFARYEAADYEPAGEEDIPELRRPKTPRLRWVQRKAIRPSMEEVEANPRARSAQLRVFERI